MELEKFYRPKDLSRQQGTLKKMTQAAGIFRRKKPASDHWERREQRSSQNAGFPEWEEHGQLSEPS